MFSRIFALNSSASEDSIKWLVRAFDWLRYKSIKLIIAHTVYIGMSDENQTTISIDANDVANYHLVFEVLAVPLLHGQKTICTNLMRLPKSRTQWLCDLKVEHVRRKATIAERVFLISLAYSLYLWMRRPRRFCCQNRGSLTSLFASAFVLTNESHTSDHQLRAFFNVSKLRIVTLTVTNDSFEVAIKQSQSPAPRIWLSGNVRFKRPWIK